MGDSKSSTAGVSGVGVVQIVFIILKLCNTNPIGGWPWWKVMLPTECSVALVCCCGCTFMGVTICALIGDKDNSVSTPGDQLSSQQRELLYNLTQETHIQTPPQLAVAVAPPTPPLGAAAVAVSEVMEEGNLSSPDSTSTTVHATHSNDMDISTKGTKLQQSNSYAFEAITEDVIQ
tara:strand:+ start:2959 stop:3486 length:528 start_codon:yes stop_codon:yes gene_type:complete